MAAHIFDIDGTLVDYHTSEWLDGALEYLSKCYTNGDDIILMTMRGPQDANSLWSIENTKKTILKDLDDLGIEYRIFFDVSSPRIIHDDRDIYLDKRITNQKWK